MRVATDMPTRDGPAWLATVEQREPLPAWIRWMSAGTLYQPEPGGHVAGAEQLRAAEALGFHFLGRFSYRGMFGRRPRREAWVDGHGVVRLSLRAGQSADPVVRQMSLYYLSTTFDDGNVIETSSRSPPPVPSSPRVTCRGGTGDLEADYESHLAAVYARCAEHAALLVPDMSTALGLATWQDTHLYPAAVVYGGLYVQTASFAALALAGWLRVARHPAWSWVFGATLALFVLGALLQSLAAGVKQRPGPSPRP